MPRRIVTAKQTAHCPRAPHFLRVYTGCDLLKCAQPQQGSRRPALMDVASPAASVQRWPSIRYTAEVGGRLSAYTMQYASAVNVPGV